MTHVGDVMRVGSDVRNLARVGGRTGQMTMM